MRLYCIDLLLLHMSCCYVLLRPQVPGPVTSDKSSSEVNIWSGRRVGPRPGSTSRGDKQRQPSQYRCHPATDTGKTRGSEGQINTFCLFFAK
jgi:hypothetical protein